MFTLSFKNINIIGQRNRQRMQWPSIEEVIVQKRSSKGSVIIIIVRDPRAARPYLFSDGQNMYNRVVSVCTVNIYIPDGQFSDTRYYRYLQNCTHFTYSLRTESHVRCRVYCKQFEINTARHILSAIFFARWVLQVSKAKNTALLTVWDFMSSIIFMGLFNILCKLPGHS